MNVDPKMRDRIRDRLPNVIRNLRSLAHEHAPEAAARREAGFTLLNATGDEAVLRIYDDIWEFGVNARDVAAELDRVTAPKIRVEINSPGGDVWDGVAIYNALRNHPAEVTTRIDGMAASIASVIFQAGDHRLVQSSSQMMIHNAWGMTVGDNRDHADMVEILKQQDRVIAGIYAAHGTADADHYEQLMDAETWMVGAEIVEQGLADEVIDTTAAGDPSNAAKRKYSDHAEAVITDFAAWVDRTEEVITFRTDQGKPPINDETAAFVARIRGESDRLVALVTPSSPEGEIPQELADRYTRLYGRQAARPTPTGV